MTDNPKKCSEKSPYDVTDKSPAELCENVSEVLSGFLGREIAFHQKKLSELLEAKKLYDNAALAVIQALR